MTYRPIGIPHAAECWVDKAGDDANYGGQDSPFATIAFALAYMAAKYTYDIRKIVNIGVGNWQEPIFLNTPNWHIKGPDHISGFQDAANNAATLYADTDTGVPIIMTDMSVAGWDAYMTAGGPTNTPTDTSYVYTGADLIGRELQPDQGGYWAQSFGIRVMDNIFENIFVLLNEEVPGNRATFDGKEIGMFIVFTGTPNSSQARKFVNC